MTTKQDIKNFRFQVYKTVTDGTEVVNFSHLARDCQEVAGVGKISTM